MTSIADAIHWKFNQLGVMSTIDNNITEFPPDIVGVHYDAMGIPLQADQDAWMAEYEVHRTATQYLRDREEAIHELLPESMYMPAMLEQAKADSDGGKTLETSLEEAVNIYDQILTDNPEPS